MKDSYKKIHFVGIGGIGMSALARYYMSAGCEVSGSDGSDSEILSELKKEGADIKISHNLENVPSDIDLLVYTVAVPSDNPELLKGIEFANDIDREKKCRVLTYAQALGEMSNDKKVIAVCGTHGKTTTTAMTFSALSNAGLNVSMIVGSLIKVKDINTGEYKMTNYVTSGDMNNLDYLIIEACEYRKSFLNYNPEIILLTNIDADHLDYYKDLKDIQNAFGEFINKLPENGKLIIHKNEENVVDFILNPEQEIGLLKKEIEEKGNRILINKKNIKKVRCEDYIKESDVILSVPGLHNRKNAQLVVALGQVLSNESSDDNFNFKIKDGLKNFTGTWRRQEYKGKHFEMECFDDYAHHPSEIKATLQAFREKLNIEEEKSNTKHKKIIACFMPHLYSRTKLLFEDFVNAFADADEILLLPIYAARENFDPNVNSEMLAREINNINKKALAFNNIETLKDYLKINSDENSVVVTMGAGDIYKVYE